MKIYIDNLNLKSLSEIQQSLKDILIDTKNYTELYTNESIYHIDNKHIFLLEPIDGDIKILKNYFDNITLITDSSYFKKSTVNSVHGIEHLHTNIKKHIYKLNPKSKISFVIETVNNLENRYIPNDVYFECNELTDIKELFNKQEIIEFLSLLN